MNGAADNTHSTLAPALAPSSPSGPPPGRVLRVPARFGSIQRAIWAAVPGDTILVSAGLYRETVHVPASKERVALVASGDVLLDARPAGISGAGPGIWIEAKGVTVLGFTIRHSRRSMPESRIPGCGVYSTGDWTVLEDLEIQDCADTGLMLEGRNSQVRRCRTVGAQEPRRTSGAQELGCLAS